jgi:hypothetical protein
MPAIPQRNSFLAKMLILPHQHHHHTITTATITTADATTITTVSFIASYHD